ncbi:MAG: hypothetical protein HQK50_10940 [Oligoflexia bacterium]|nr:hypothetical protein [Oligoflexia bacterium]MBF0366078.1 hypothetical protein [Oligoflexia bacterium]
MELTIPERDRAKKYQGIENLQLMLRGSYEYTSHKKIYSEENFLVYKNSKDNSMIFDSELLTRLDSGEFLKVMLSYHINKNWVPLEVTINKQVGKQNATEIYQMDLKKNTLTYQFIANNQAKVMKLQVPPKYQIATYNTVSSFLFISSKKYDPTGRNYYNILVTNNLLEYQGPPQMNYIVLERISTTPQNVRVNDKNLKAIIYRIYSQSGHEKKTEEPIISCISRHYSIPYVVEGPKNLRIQIKFLSEVEGNALSDFS